MLADLLTALSWRMRADGGDTSADRLLSGIGALQPEMWSRLMVLKDPWIHARPGGTQNTKKTKDYS